MIPLGFILADILTIIIIVLLVGYVLYTKRQVLIDKINEY